MGACAPRIAVVSVGIQASSLHAARADAAAWRMPSPHAPPTRIKPLGWKEPCYTAARLGGVAQLVRAAES